MAYVPRQNSAAARLPAHLNGPARAAPRRAAPRAHQARKFPPGMFPEGAVVPVVQCILEGFDVVYAPLISSYGAATATLEASPGTDVEVGGGGGGQGSKDQRQRGQLGPLPAPGGGDGTGWHGLDRAGDRACDSGKLRQMQPGGSSQ
jgi:hypothetical protein